MEHEVKYFLEGFVDDFFNKDFDANIQAAKINLVVGRMKQQILETLKLPDIDVSVDIDSIQYSSCLHTDKNKYSVSIYPPDMEQGLLWDFLPIKIEDFEARLFFVLAHEIAHYYQCVKHPKWMEEKYITRIRFIKDSHNSFDTDEVHCKKYRKLRAEQNADRIAIILLRKFGYIKTESCMVNK